MMKSLLFICLATVSLVLVAGQESMEERMMREWMEQVAGKGGYPPKPKDDDDDKDKDKDKMDDDKMKMMMKMLKELGIASGPLGGQPKDWIEMMMMMKKDNKHKHDDSCEHDKDDDKKDQIMGMFKEFKDFLEKKKEEKEKMKEEEEHKKEYQMKLKEYMKMKMYEMYQQRKQQMAHEKRMVLKEAMNKLKYVYVNMTQQHMMEKFKFTYGITQHVLDNCQCDETKELMYRLKKGHFGYSHQGSKNDTGGHPNGTNGHHNGTNATDTSSNSNNNNNNNNSNNNNGTSGGGNNYSNHSTNGTSGIVGTVQEPQQPPAANDGSSAVDGAMSHDMIMKTVYEFHQRSPEEQFELALYKLTWEMCGAAGKYIEHLRELEAYLAAYRRSHSQ